MWVTIGTWIHLICKVCQFVCTAGKETPMKKKKTTWELLENISRILGWKKLSIWGPLTPYFPKCSEEVYTRYFLNRNAISYPEVSLQNAVQQINPLWGVRILLILLCCHSHCLRSIFGSLLIIWIDWVSLFVILGIVCLVSWKGTYLCSALAKLLEHGDWNSCSHRVFCVSVWGKDERFWPRA